MERRTISILKEVKTELLECWCMVYDESKEEMEGELYDLRMKLNSLQCDINKILDKGENKNAL